MIIDRAMTRAQWAARVRQQVEEIPIMAGSSSERAMQGELLLTASRLTEHARHLDKEAQAICESP